MVLASLGTALVLGEVVLVSLGLPRRQHRLHCPLPYLQAKARAVSNMYFPLDGHWTVEGNQAMAEAIAIGLTQLGLWPPHNVRAPTTGRDRRATTQPQVAPDDRAR